MHSDELAAAIVIQMVRGRFNHQHLVCLRVVRSIGHCEKLARSPAHPQCAGRSRTAKLNALFKPACISNPVLAMSGCMRVSPKATSEPFSKTSQTKLDAKLCAGIQALHLKATASLRHTRLFPKKQTLANLRYLSWPAEQRMKRTKQGLRTGSRMRYSRTKD
jgi:hypothetical protein